jgi:2-iminoacetate synthase ThiH
MHDVEQTVTLSHEQLEDMLEAAADRGARKALASVGLHDENAPTDIRQLRDLLSMYRIVRKSALAAFGQALMFALIGAAALWLGIKLNIGAPK